ncbi:MAG: sigma-54 dependent transcriptional regulator [Rhodanobacteraceae bacterium]
MSIARILVVDDEPDIRDLVADILIDEGYAVEQAANVDEARARKREWHPELILLDIWMPGQDGISLLREWVNAGPLDASVIMMSGHGSIETAVEATRLGAWDFIEKPIALAKLLLTVQRALEAGRLSRQNESLRQQLTQPVEPIGQSGVMQALRAQVDRLAALDTHVLIRGERGSGKESLARWLHGRSVRSDGPFVMFGGSGLGSADMHRVLLGYADHAGLFEQAEGGTLLLDEVADLDGELQALLAQVLERGTVQRQGDSQALPVNVRVIATTTEDLEARIKSGAMREELYYQLNVASLGMPALRQRIEDVPLLLKHFAEQFAARDNLPYRLFPAAVQNRLRQHDWPGNVRELRAMVQRLLIMEGGDDVSLEEVEQALAPAPARTAGSIEHHIDLGLELREAREQFERDYLSRQLRAVNGSVTRLAGKVGLERTHLYRKLRDLGIDLKRDKSGA